MAQLRGVEAIRRYLNIDSVETVRRLIKQKHIPHFREGPRFICSSTEVLDEWLAARNQMIRESCDVVEAFLMKKPG